MASSLRCVDSTGTPLKVGDEVIITSGVGLRDVCVVESMYQSSMYPQNDKDTLRITTVKSHEGKLHKKTMWTKSTWRLTQTAYVMDEGL